MLKLLTIDDETEFTTFLRSYFEPRGYQVFTANEGEAGIRIGTEQQPDIALIDLRMPGKHGDEVMREIRRASPHTQCIMITASEGQGKTRERLLAEGAYACFDKPLSSLKDLEMKIKEALAHVGQR
jgi:CheY-like chemotaxis protein